MTQLGLAPICEPERYFHFNSRTSDSEANLTALTRDWVKDTFGQTGEAYIAPDRVIGNGGAAISFGVGENESKRIAGDFEARMIRALGEKFQTIWIDRGAGGEEARRVTAAARDSGCVERIHFWEGSFAGFASLISQCALYAGYDSAGQHAAAASGVPLITFFKGAPSVRFRERWKPAGAGRVTVIDADGLDPEGCLKCLGALLE
jgi:ADP-heptose:LPS heptosyltransferase